VPAPIPQRTRAVYFLGAGFSRALDLPNTAELLTEVHKLALSQNLAIDRKLKDAYKFFYPEESPSFVPDVVDFFSVLRAYEDVRQHRWRRTSFRRGLYSFGIVD